MTIQITANIIDVTEERLNEETGLVETVSYQLAEPSEPIDYQRAKKVESVGGVYYVEY
jgi:hypothetical protein